MTTNPQTDEVRAAALLVAEARRAVHESLAVLAAPEADRVRALVADLETAIEGRTAICLSAVSVPAPEPTDEPALRDRIAAAVRTVPIKYGEDSITPVSREEAGILADAVLTVLPDTPRLHDRILTLQAELATVRDLLRSENGRANSAINRETTAEEHAEEQRLALSQALGLGTGAPWDAIRDRAAEVAAAASGSGRAADETQAEGEPIVRATKYTVNCLPEDGFDSDVFALTVEYRGSGRWGVYRNAYCCLGADGTWSYGYAWRDGAQEPSGDEEWTEYHAGRDAWLDAHRFDEETALRLAREHAPRVRVNGITVREALSRMVVEATPAKDPS